MGPEVGRMQAREKTRVLTARDEGYEETHERGRMWAKQEWDGASDVRATQRDAAGSRHALGNVQISRTHEKAHAVAPLLR